jgi:hypothetical protein
MQNINPFLEEIKLAEYVAYIKDISNIYRILVKRHESKRPLEKSRRM